MLASSRTAKRLAPVLIAAACLAACSAQGQTAAPPVALTPVDATVSSGALRGYVEDGVRIFKGVPYAQAPVGDLRWRPPQPAKAWTGVREAQAFGPDCMQNRVGWDDTQTRLPASEDCLTLNVWTPKDAKSAPVMVWIHGGGYVMGSGSQPVFDGAALARRGVVVVTFNYRLGRFGFFAHPALDAEHPDEPKANYAFMDQIAALAWVRANIAALGGDPARVTIFGQSAGGGSVSQMMLIPQARGLFHQAIAQSGGGRDVWPLVAADRPGKVSAEAIGVAFADKAGAKDAAALRALPAAKLLGKLDLLNMEEATFSGPVVDGRLVTGSAVEGFAAGKQAKIPLLIGANSDELGIIPGFLKGMFAGKTIAQLGLPEDKLLAIYGTKSALNNDLPSDATFVEPAHALAGLAAKGGQPVWTYSFGYVVEAKRKDWRGAPHSGDLGFVFDTLGKLKDAPSPADQAVATRWADTWATFAKTGDPGWARYDPAIDQRMTVTNDGAALAATPERIRALGALRDAQRAETSNKKGEGEKMKSLKTALVLGTSIGALATGNAMAQTQGQAAKPDETMMITEVVVTAQKREEKLQDVPIAVSVVGETDLQRRNIGNIDQLKLLVPSFEATSFGVSVRGVGTSTFSTSIEPTVSTVLDGVVLGRPEMALGSFYDVARVEILRGPQGMLFGKNASAGLVSITTNAPKLGRVEAIANLNLGQDGYNKSDATVNLPLGDKAALRVGGFVNKQDGVLTNKKDGRKFNGNDEWGARAKLLWRPSDTVDVLITADYAKQDQSITWSPYLLNPTGVMGLTLGACGVKASPKNADLCIDGPQYKDRENYGFAAQVDWSLPGGLTLTSITAGRRDFDFSNGDSDSLPINILNNNISNQDLRQVSQELRLASPTGGKLEYVAGLYYYRQKTNQVTDQTGTFGVSPAPVINSTINSLVDTRSYALFGQASYQLTDKLALIGGARLTKDKVSLDFRQFTRPGFFGINPTVTFDDTAKETNVSWKVGVQYQLAERAMGYATVSRGYKGPGFNQTGVSNATTSQEVGPEIPTSYELGVKTTLLGGLAVLNLAAFATKFEDYQAQTVDFTLTPPAFRTINAGELKTKGIEGDLTAVLAPGLLVTASAAYIDAQYGSFAPISCDPVTTPSGCVLIAPGLYGFNASGRSLSGVSKWKTSLAAVYERSIGHGLQVNASADYGWRDGYNASATGDPSTAIKSYGILGGTIGIGSENDRWRLAVWGKNLTDKRFPSALFTTPFGGKGDYSQVLTGDAFRRYGVTLNLRY